MVWRPTGSAMACASSTTSRPAATGAPTLGRLAAYVRDCRIPLEMCPTSNLQTGAADSIAAHPITLLKDLRFRVTVNTDNRLMSGTSMSREMQLLVDEAGWTLADLRWATINAMKSAFIPSTSASNSSSRSSSRYAALGARRCPLPQESRPERLLANQSLRRRGCGARRGSR